METWVDKARAVHGDKYDYSKSVYTKAGTKIMIICPVHGPFQQKAIHHTSGHGCKQCAISKKKGQELVIVSTQRTDEWVTKARAVHGDKYDYSQSVYTKAHSKISVICPEHGIFEQVAKYHLKGGGCIKCQYNGFRKDTEKWVEDARRVHGLKYDYSKAKYVSNHKKLIIICQDHGIFEQKAITHLEGHGCPGCAAIASATARMPTISSLSRAVATLLDYFNVDYTLEYVHGPWVFDVFIPSHNLLIECHGNYWHNSAKVRERDKRKLEYTKTIGLRLIEIWEVEFYKAGRLREIIAKTLGIQEKPKNQVVFDLLSLKQIDSFVAKTFLDLHHYLGSLRGRIHYGLFYHSVLIGVCSFGSFSRNEQTKKYKGAVELTRFCLHPEYQVKNLGSWFLSRCLKLIGKPVVTYADTTLGHDGALYKATNFKYLHTVKPDYHYVDQNGWVIHKRTVWGRAKLMKISEIEYSEKHGLVKKWGGEKLCFGYGLTDFKC